MRLTPFLQKNPVPRKISKDGKNFFLAVPLSLAEYAPKLLLPYNGGETVRFYLRRKKRVPAEAREGVRRKAACCVAPNRSSLLFEKKREFSLLISVIAFGLYKICIYIINFLLRLSSANGKKFIFLRQNQALRFLRRSKGVQENKIPLFHHGKCEL